MIQNGDDIMLHYTGSVEGNVFDSSKEKDPFAFKVGSETVIPGFQDAVIGMKEGDKKTITIPVEKAYGVRDEKLFTEVPLEKLGDLPEKVNIQKGVSFQLCDKMNNQCIVTVSDVKEGSVILDLNHPLAGKELTFELEILKVIKAQE